jgi:hypothetical protein
VTNLLVPVNSIRSAQLGRRDGVSGISGFAYGPRALSWIVSEGGLATEVHAPWSWKVAGQSFGGPPNLDQEAVHGVVAPARKRRCGMSRTRAHSRPSRSDA